MSRLMRAIVLLSIAGAFAAKGEAQTAGLGIRPMRLELEVAPGKEKTAAVIIEAPVSDDAVRGRLILSVTDWTINEDTTVTYQDVGALSNSASEWITFSPTDFTIASGEQRLVRVTTKVPIGTLPGVYTSAIFVQERPPATLPQKGERLLYFRFRYVVTIYIIVEPVSKQGELTDLRLTNDAKGTRISAQLKNASTQHLRPNLSWFLRSGSNELLSVKDVEATVLLPAKITNETLTTDNPLPPGDYEIEVQADFHDGRPVQAIKRAVNVRSPQKADN